MLVDGALHDAKGDKIKFQERPNPVVIKAVYFFRNQKINVHTELK